MIAGASIAEKFRRLKAAANTAVDANHPSPMQPCCFSTPPARHGGQYRTDPAFLAIVAEADDVSDAIDRAERNRRALAANGAIGAAFTNEKFKHIKRGQSATGSANHPLANADSLLRRITSARRRPCSC